ncbi:MAG: prepilin-type N-terminal cleavage/methylation domain-containing protein [Acidimicrobiales bacterium]|jgi:prepilin-type N-terminal cleavage/methylation domain-containing protein
MFQATLRRLREAHATEIEGEETAEAGFTLIELMVVLLIIAILLAIAIPTFLGVTNTAGDRASQSNLTNALTEAKALYQVTQAYSSNSGGGGAYTSGAFAAQAPEFTWVAGSANCETNSSSNCISVAIADVASQNDAQGVALAAWSAKTSTCWYAIDLEATPSVITTTPADANAVQQTGSKNIPGTGTTGLPSAGVFYAKAVKPATCAASTAINPTGVANWTTTYSTAGALS